MKFFFYIISLSFITYSCSFDTNPSYSDNKNIKKVKKIASKVNIGENNSFDEIKNIIINYGKNSSYPDMKD